MPTDYPLKLTPGEKHLLKRRRDGQNQRQRAAALGLSLSAYSYLEREHVLAPKGVATPEVVGIKPHERCVIYRRRAGFTQSQVARDLQYCRYTVNQMERGEGDCTDLLSYWES